MDFSGKIFIYSQIKKIQNSEKKQLSILILLLWWENVQKFYSKGSLEGVFGNEYAKLKMLNSGFTYKNSKNL